MDGYTSVGRLHVPLDKLLICSRKTEKWEARKHLHTSCWETPEKEQKNSVMRHSIVSRKRPWPHYQSFQSVLQWMKITHIHIPKRMDFFGDPREMKSSFAAWSAMTHSCAAPQITALFKPTPGSSTILWPFPTRPCSNCRVSPIWLLIKTPCHVLFRHFLHGRGAIKWLRSTHFSPSLLHPNHFHSCLMANESRRHFS